ncbi:hypothetical protein L596_011601 [Steinernema carpocapsae]|uniref:Uncharacterized protein n=1 Tax=Steinernema carpocapsae TaxID=34508 RepID=A0A4U5NV72_STECR|nr:hypothetical protein L596_011601 [Steinernema carpocapsae]
MEIFAFDIVGRLGFGGKQGRSWETSPERPEMGRFWCLRRACGGRLHAAVRVSFPFLVGVRFYDCAQDGLRSRRPLRTAFLALFSCTLHIGFQRRRIWCRKTPFPPLLGRRI